MNFIFRSFPLGVAPFAGAWIETPAIRVRSRQKQSLPSRERGLKHTVLDHLSNGLTVAPFAGAWIETLDLSSVYLT